MGQKVSPVGLRIGINKDWDAKWYAKKRDFSKFLGVDIKIREYLSQKLKDAAVSKVLIERNKKRTEITISTAKPGIVIGRGGAEITELKKALTRIAGEVIQVSVVEVKNPNMNAALVADSIAKQLENRASFRMAQKKAIRNAMKSGAKGIKTLVSGRLNGADIARKEGYTEGNVPLHTLRADIDYAAAEAHTVYGILGVKIWIYKGEILNKKDIKKTDKEAK